MKFRIVLYADYWYKAPQVKVDINDDIILQIGQLVKHKKFGIGKNQDLDGSKAVVDFDEHGKKKLISDFLTPC